MRAGAPDHGEIITGWVNVAVNWKYGPFVVCNQAPGLRKKLIFVVSAHCLISVSFS